MNPEDIGTFLDALAERLSPSAVHVFELVQKQMMIEAVAGAVSFSVAFLVLIVLTPRCIRAWADQTDKLSDLVLGVGIPGGWITLLFFLLFTAGEIVTRIFNPEWAAIQYIINQVSN